MLLTISLLVENEGEWDKMIVIEKFNGDERRTRNMTDRSGVTWQLNLCNYDNCNDFEDDAVKPSPTKTPSSSSMTLPALPLLMFIVLASVLTL